MSGQQSWKTRKVESSQILRCRRILETERQEAMMSLERLGDETREVDSDGPQDVADICTTNLSKEALFQAGRRQQNMSQYLKGHRLQPQ